MSEPTADDVPEGLRRTAAWAWRLLVILILGSAALLAVAQLQTLFVALFVALLLTALLHPAAEWLHRRGVPPSLATAGVLLGAVAGIVGALYLAGRAIGDQVYDLAAAAEEGYLQVVDWAQATFGFDLNALPDLVDNWSGALGGSGGSGSVVSSVFGAAGTAVEVLSGAGIALFATIFFVYDGARIWRWLLSLFPRGARFHVDQAGLVSWQTLSSYARGTVLIAAIDGIGIGLGAALIGVPLAAPIGLLVFFFSFIPIVGALLSGLVAVLIALASQGLTGALLMLAVVLLVQQLEGQVLQPIIQGKLVAIHPLAVVLAVAGGSIIAGIVGAVIAVPIIAVLNVIVRYVHSVATSSADEDPEQAPASHDAARGPAEQVREGPSDGPEPSA